MERSFTVHLLGPIQSDAFRRMNLRQTKNDAKNSLMIAQLLRFGKYSCTKLAQEEMLALRNLSRYHLHLVDTCSDWKRRLIGIMDPVFPKYETLFSDIFGVTSKQLLQQYLFPEDMLRVSAKKLSRLLEKAAAGDFLWKKPNKFSALLPQPLGSLLPKRLFLSRTGKFCLKSIFWKHRFVNWKSRLPNCLRKAIMPSSQALPELEMY
ncbi:MAG: transposase [Peptostreptococcaceae bacterium]|nr:transposase [Peptostreptococcaceae bacterium]